MNQIAPKHITRITAPGSLVELKSVATKFRHAIERCDPRRLSITFQDFPKGSCGDATLLLGTFFQERSLGTFMYALGTRHGDEGHHSHAWLEVGKLVVDITADQFSEIDEKVIVAENSAWHAAFQREDDEHVADYRIYDPHTVSVLGSSYGVILAEFERL